jgi:hypothetical protein
VESAFDPAHGRNFYGQPTIPQLTGYNSYARLKYALGRDSLPSIAAPIETLPIDEQEAHCAQSLSWWPDYNACFQIQPSVSRHHLCQGGWAVLRIAPGSVEYNEYYNETLQLLAGYHFYRLDRDYQRLAGILDSLTDLTLDPVKPPAVRRQHRGEDRQTCVVLGR